MDQLLEAIRVATLDGATDETRAAGAQACRTILTALEATPGESLASATVDASPMHAVVAALRGMPPEQLLDLAIARLKAALPAGEQAPAVQPVKFQLLPVAALGGPPCARLLRSRAPSHRRTSSPSACAPISSRASSA